MKISELLKTPNLTSITLSVLNPSTIVSEIHIKGKSKAVKKLYQKLDVDIEIPEVSNKNVEHLGIKKYFHLVEKDFYINLYYY